MVTILLPPLGLLLWLLPLPLVALSLPLPLWLFYEAGSDALLFACCESGEVETGTSGEGGGDGEGEVDGSLLTLVDWPLLFPLALGALLLLVKGGSNSSGGIPPSLSRLLLWVEYLSTSGGLCRALLAGMNCEGWLDSSACCRRD